MLLDHPRGGNTQPPRLVINGYQRLTQAPRTSRMPIATAKETRFTQLGQGKLTKLVLCSALKSDPAIMNCAEKANSFALPDNILVMNG
jgi:hypothetical protein